ncbi:MAG: trimethylamine methyltransferase family protein [Planctomycetota bacterium]
MTPDNANRIHEASLALLDNPGVRIEHDAICDRLVKAGAVRGTQPQEIRFPRQLVEECLALAPRQVRLGTHDASGGVVMSSTSPTQVWSTPGMNVFRQGRSRLATSQDMVDIAKLVQQLPRVDGVFGLALSDTPPRTSDVIGLRIMAENCRKHIRAFCSTPQGARALCRMKPVLGNDTWFSIGFTAHGPLRWTNLALEIFAQTAGHGIPASINGEPMAGVSGPVTLAGSAAVGNAEILAGLVVNQVLEPGRPCIYNLGLAHIFDMRTAIAVTGGPENHLLADISAAMGRLYQLPSCSWVSTESMCMDEQAALEKSLGYLSHQQSGVSLIWGAGQLESELTISAAQVVIDDEILGYTRRMLRGVEVTDASLALDVVRSVGIAKDFLTSEHTLENYKQELFSPALLFRSRRAVWEKGGSKDLAQRAEEKAEQLIQREVPPCVTPDQSKALREIEQQLIGELAAAKAVAAS